jgi:hypothetical protein
MRAVLLKRLPLTGDRELVAVAHSELVPSLARQHRNTEKKRALDRARAAVDQADAPDGYFRGHGLSHLPNGVRVITDVAFDVDST